jgi:hypothetical protein
MIKEIPYINKIYPGLQQMNGFGVAVMPSSA